MQGLLRVGGRLSYSSLDFDAKHPLILFDRDPLTTLIIRQVHLATLHGGILSTLSAIRSKYWILRGRMAVKMFINQCHKCIRYTGTKQVQKMGDLPPCRGSAAPPFQETGIDYAGPVLIRLTKSRGKGTMKAYIAVFICMNIRAVHLELVEDYSSEAFIAAFQRFTSRRGKCSDLYSDRGTNFVGADACLRALFKQFCSENSQVFRELTADGTQWHFNPPSAAHFGGLWEAAVKSAKKHLRRVIGNQILTFSELYTVLCQIEAVLNSRPMIPISTDKNDLSPLTPAHFLILRESFLVPVSDLSTVKIPDGKRWERTRQIVQHFWRRWSDEYLATLQTRDKWFTAQPSLGVGDLILVTGENTKPGDWPLGLITAVHPGKGGLVRVVDIRTAATTLTRPVVKLCLLRRRENLTG